MTEELFQLALNITTPWFVSDLKFNIDAKRLDVYIDFEKGATFEYEDAGKTHRDLKAYDTKSKTWRHLRNDCRVLNTGYARW